jgi:hypothetical protein
MIYIIILLALLVILSPLMWFRVSPRQKIIISMRQEASRLGLIVKLSTAGDARLDEKYKDYITYGLPWQLDSIAPSQPNMENWLLVRGSNRGDASIWPDWNWLGRECNKELMSVIGPLLPSLPSDISALKASSKGIEVFWREHGKIADIVVIKKVLVLLKKSIRVDLNQ